MVSCSIWDAFHEKMINLFVECMEVGEYRFYDQAISLIREDMQIKSCNNVAAFIFFLIIPIIFATAGPSFAFRCGTSLVIEGDTKPEVIQKCGEPDYVDSWQEERFSRNYPSVREYDPDNHRYYRRYREPFLVKEYVTIDVWTYNLGSNRFIRYLTFENGILIEISTGERGY